MKHNTRTSALRVERSHRFYMRLVQLDPRRYAGGGRDANARQFVPIIRRRDGFGDSLLVIAGASCIQGHGQQQDVLEKIKHMI